MIVVSPVFLIMTVRTPEISATYGLLLVNVNVAAGFVLFDDGSVKLNEPSLLYVREAIEKSDKVGVIRDIILVIQHHL